MKEKYTSVIYKLECKDYDSNKFLMKNYNMSCLDEKWSKRNK